MNESDIIELRDEERTRCEIWTRVMGYHRPVSAFNAGKRAEHGERCYFSEEPQQTTQRANLPRQAQAGERVAA
jgi:hypothetical protein